MLTRVLCVVLLLSTFGCALMGEDEPQLLTPEFFAQVEASFPAAYERAAAEAAASGEVVDVDQVMKQAALDSIVLALTANAEGGGGGLFGSLIRTWILVENLKATAAAEVTDVVAPPAPPPDE